MTMSTINSVKALHVHDAASVGRSLIDAANAMGQSWSMTDIPWYYRREWSGLLRHPALRTRPAFWDATLAAKSICQDIVHLHTGGLSPHMRWLKVPWVLHLHGTDVRSRQYDGWADKLSFGAQYASAVLYSTPDLLPHVLRLEPRTEPIYFPGPVSSSDAPPWVPVRSRVIFASRWDSIKGGADQVAVAREIKNLTPEAELFGLDWGKDTEMARSAGVTLFPRMPRREYREWLSTASVVIGQMTSILSISELEALSIGVPLVSSASRKYYPELKQLGDPTISGVAEAASEALADPISSSELQQGKRFIAQKHDVRVGVKNLLSIYDEVLSRR